MEVCGGFRVAIGAAAGVQAPKTFEEWTSTTASTLKQLGVAPYSICGGSGCLDDAKRYLTHAIAVNGDGAEAHGSLAAVYASAGDPNSAIVHYEKALALAPNHPGIHYAFAALLHPLGRNVEAIEHLKRALTVRPDHLDAYFTLGLVPLQKSWDEGLLGERGEPDAAGVAIGYDSIVVVE